MGSGRSIRAGRAFVELYADQSKLVRGLRKAEGELRAFGARAQRIGRDMMMAAGAMAVPMALATKTFVSFEDEMAKVKALSGAVGKTFEKLTDQAKELGRTTTFTATQVAAGMTSLSRMGFDPSQIEAAIPAILNLARATDTELAQAAEIAGRAVRGFGLDASETTRVADVLTAAAGNSSQVLTDLGESLGYATPIMRAAGESIESTAKALGIMANMGILSSRAGTSYQAMALQIAKPEVQVALQKMGIYALDAQKNIRPLSAVLSEVGLKMKDMGTGQRINLAEMLFGRRAIGGALNLGGPMDAMQKLIDAVDNAGGTAKRVAGIMDATLGGAFLRMKSAIEAVAIEIGAALKPDLEELADWIQKNAAAMAVWVEQHKEVVVNVAKVTAGVGALGAGLVALGAVANGAATTIALVAAAATAVGTAFTFLMANPIVAGIALFAASMVALNSTLKQVLDTTAQLSDEMAKLRKAGDEQRAEDQSRIKQLESLAKKEKLNNDEMETAQEIIWDLTGRYGDLGLKLNDTTSEVDGLAGAFDRLATAMREQQMDQVAAEIKEAEENIAELRQSMDATADSMGKHVWNDVLAGATFNAFPTGAEAASNEIEAIGADLADRQKALRELRQEYAEIEARGMYPAAGAPAADAGGVAGGVPDPNASAETIAAFSLKIERRLHDLKIANIADEELRALAAISARYERERVDAKAKGLTDFTGQRQAERTETAAAMEKFDEERKQEEKQLFEDREARELQLRDENAHLEIDATKEGLDKQLAHIALAKKRAIAEAAAAGDDTSLVEEEYALRERIARQSAAENQAGPEFTQQGSTSAAALKYFSAGQSDNKPAKDTAKHTKEMVKLLKKMEKGGGLAGLRFT